MEFEFFNTIPATGNGYYKLVMWKIIENVTPKYTEVFSSDFSSWTEGEPDDFTITDNGGSPTIENDGDRAKMTADGFLNKYKIILIPDLIAEINRKYRIGVKIDQGGLYISSGGNQVFLSTTGTFQVLLIAGSTQIRLRANGAISIIDDLIIEEEI